LGKHIGKKEEVAAADCAAEKGKVTGKLQKRIVAADTDNEKCGTPEARREDEQKKGYIDNPPGILAQDIEGHHKVYQGGEKYD
jgi:hypothetical protein